MNRRDCLQMSLPLLFLTFGCFDEPSGGSSEQIAGREDDLINTFNMGDFEKLESFFLKVCTFASVNVAGDLDRLMRVLRVSHRRYEKQKLLPLSIRARTMSVESELAWSLIELGTAANERKFGHLTLILSEAPSGWQVRHYHFSQ